METYYIDFDGHVKAKITVKDGKLEVVAAVSGFGNAIPNPAIKIEIK